MNNLKIEHIAVASNSEVDSDNFYVDLLKFQKIKSFTVSKELMNQFFGINKDQHVIRYSKESVNIEVFIINGNDKSFDNFTHTCIIIEDRDKLVDDAIKKGYEVIKVPRDGSENYFLFIKDDFGNLFEVKSQ
ncbi:MAG: VOC family protein [Promethearchaeota archaeon]